MKTSFVRRGGLWAAGQFLLLGAVVWCGLRADTANAGGGVFILGGALFLLGAVVGIAGAVALGRHRTPFIEPRADSELVRHGIYRFIRHPLYASLILLCAGWAVLWQSVPGGVAAGLLTLLLDAKARREEARLRARFPEYADYERRVKRLVPGVY